MQVLVLLPHVVEDLSEGQELAVGVDILLVHLKAMGERLEFQLKPLKDRTITIFLWAKIL